MRKAKTFLRNLKTLFKSKEECVSVCMVTNHYELDKNSQPKDMIIYTIVNSFDECRTYLTNLLKITEKEHFELWCENHLLDASKESSWLRYVDESLKDKIDNTYLIGKYVYPLSQITSILRMFHRCQPMGCEFESDKEYAYYLKGLAEDRIRNVLMQNEDANEEQVCEELEDEITQILEEMKKQDELFKSTS